MALTISAIVQPQENDHHVGTERGGFMESSYTSGSRHLARRAIFLRARPSIAANSIADLGYQPLVWPGETLRTGTASIATSLSAHNSAAPGALFFIPARLIQPPSVMKLSRW